MNPALKLELALGLVKVSAEITDDQFTLAEVARLRGKKTWHGFAHVGGRDEVSDAEWAAAQKSLASQRKKKAGMSGAGGAAAGLLGWPGAALYGGLSSDKHPGRDALAMTGGSMAGATAGGLGAYLLAALAARGRPGAAGGGLAAAMLGSTAGSSVGSGLTARHLAQDNTPKWRKALGI